MLPMEKSFTPLCTPEQFEKLLAESHTLCKAKKGLVKDIMAYVQCTKEILSNDLGNVKLFLN
ncbi:MAG: hypothetical protein C0599_10225 [Salinivirgaceae bacterium]|nr:MAG: hypothetical protein C0599_10225 [Salinivirgaceae bacterium]